MCEECNHMPFIDRLGEVHTYSAHCSSNKTFKEWFRYFAGFLFWSARRRSSQNIQEAKCFWNFFCWLHTAVDANLCFATPILCTPFSAGCGGGIEPPTEFLKRGGRGTGQYLNFERGLLGKNGWLFSRGVAVFSQKINWNLKYLLTKSFINKNVFLYIRTKNLNWEILPKNSVTWDEMGF